MGRPCNTGEPCHLGMWLSSQACCSLPLMSLQPPHLNSRPTTWRHFGGRGHSIPGNAPTSCACVSALPHTTAFTRPSGHDHHTHLMKMLPFFPCLPWVNKLNRKKGKKFSWAISVLRGWTSRESTMLCCSRWAIKLRAFRIPVLPGWSPTGSKSSAGRAVLPAPQSHRGKTCWG